MHTDTLTYTHYTLRHIYTVIPSPPTGDKWEATYQTEIVDVCGPDEEPIKANTVKVDLHCL